MIEKIAAIDLFDGRVVRLMQGDYEMVTEYGDPYEIAADLDQSNFDRIHIINLNGARGEVFRNLEIIARIARTSSKPVQVGGGIRSFEDAKRLLEMGVDVIVSTLFFENLDHFNQLVTAYPNRVILSLDLKDGNPMTRGWFETANNPVSDLASSVNAMPLKGVIITNIAGDGTLKGVDQIVFKAAADFLTVPLMAAGGIASMADLDLLEKLGYTGAIIGRAFYEGMVTC